MSASAISDIRRYISTQEAYHHKKAHLEELGNLLKEVGVDYNPQYLD